jgi:hypothetical protein
MIGVDLAEHVEHFRARVLQDALTEALPSYWAMRAEQFQAAAPRPGDFNGNATPEELQARLVDCLITAAACRRHAELLGAGLPDYIAEEISAVLGEVA